MTGSDINPGDFVSYVTKDSIGLQAITAKVEAVDTQGGKSIAHLRTYPANGAIAIPLDVLTKVKVVWQDTMKPVVDRRGSDAILAGEVDPKATMPRKHKPAPKIVAALGKVEVAVNNGILKARPQSGVAQESRNWAAQVRQLFGDYGHASGFLLSDNTVLVYWHGVWGIADDTTDDDGEHYAAAKRGGNLDEILYAMNDGVRARMPNEMLAWAKTLQAAVWAKGQEDEPKGNLAPRVEEDEEEESLDSKCPKCGGLFDYSQGHTCPATEDIAVKCPLCHHIHWEDEDHTCPEPDEEDSRNTLVEAAAEEDPGEGGETFTPREEGLIESNGRLMETAAEQERTIEELREQLAILAVVRRQEEQEAAEQERVVAELREQLRHTQDVVRRQEERIRGLAKTKLSNADLQAVLKDAARIGSFAEGISRLIRTKLPEG